MLICLNLNRRLNTNLLIGDMKNFYILIAVYFFATTGSYAQNWEPFPYDSVYFINEDNTTDILVPVVKSANSDDLLLKMHSKVEQGFIERSVTDMTLPSYQSTDPAGIHWFGDQLDYNMGILSFKSVFSDETLTIDLNAEIGAIDSQSFMIDNESFYLLVETDNQYFDTDINDSVKSITLTLTDHQFIPKEFNFSPNTTSENCTDVDMFNLGYSSLNKKILIGKTTGLQEIPNLAFYPFCRSFSKYKTVGEVKTILLDSHLEIGDVIQGTSRQFYVGSGNSNINYDYSMVITDVELDVTGDRYIYTAEYSENTTPLDATPTIETESDKEFEVKLYSNDLFTGNEQQGNGFGTMLHMDSKWGYPYIQNIHQQPFPTGGLIGFQLAYLQTMTHADVTIENEPGEVSGGRNQVDCITYYNINGVQFGTEEALSLEDHENIGSLQLGMNNNVISLNKAIRDIVNIYDINGRQISSIHLMENTDTFNSPVKLESGVYFVQFKEANKTFKLIVE